MGFCKGRPDLQTGHCGDCANVCVIHLKLVGGGREREEREREEGERERRERERRGRGGDRQ